MRIVIDTSVVIAVIANEPEKARLIELTQGAAFIAPHSVYWEIGNAFSAMLTRGRTDYKKVKKAIEVFKTIPIRFVDVGLESSLKIAEAANCYCYDAYLIRCAQKYRASLITLDKKLIAIAGNMNIKIIEVE